VNTVTRAMLTAEQAADYAGYGTVRKFRLAIKRGVMPKPRDPDARPQLWSRFEIDGVLMPQGQRAHTQDLEKLDRVLGLA